MTGASGYLGSVLLPQLAAQPWVERVIALDLNPVPATDRVISYRLDIRDGEALRAILAEHAVTHLIHAAFVVSPPAPMSEAEMQSINVNGSMHVFRAALDRQIQHVTFISSVAVYGYRAGLPHRLTEHTEYEPNMLYGKHKVAVERFLREPQNSALQSRLAILRPTAIVGPLGKQYSHLRPLTAQGFFVVANGGKARTQALHEQDAADLIMRVVEENTAGTFNAAPNDDISWAEIGKLSRLPILSFPRPLLQAATKLQKVLPALRGFNSEVVALFAESLVADNTELRRCTGWTPQFSSRQAFEQFF